MREASRTRKQQSGISAACCVRPTHISLAHSHPIPPPLIMEQPQHPPDLVGVQHWLHRTLKQHKLASFTHRLLRDALTVALGMKSAALLDFHLPPPVLERVLQRIHATDAQLFTPLVLLTLFTPTDTSVFMLHRPSFLHDSRLQASAVPLVDISPSLANPRLLTSETAASMIDQLHSFNSMLITALEADTSLSHLTLHSPPSLCLPTLCGWLLSYPLLYTFPSTFDVPSTNCLSNQPLTVFTLSLHPTALLSRLSPPFASESGCVLLQSFSVPSRLLSESVVVAALQAWEVRVDEVCSSEAVSRWVHRLSISKATVCLPHVSL